MLTTESALSALKTACIKKTYKSFKDLQPGEYVVTNFCAVETKHGNRIRIVMNNSYMYLPDRFSETLTDDVIADLNASPKIMIYGGKDATDRNRLILDFEDVAYVANQMF